MQSVKRAGLEEFLCNQCGYIYDPISGDPDNFVSPCTPLERTHDKWSCPVCGTGRDGFVVLDDIPACGLIFAH